MVMSHDTLTNHLKTNFNLAELHNWSFREIDDMIPWERSIYLELLVQKIQNEQRLAQDLAIQNRR